MLLAPASESNANPEHAGIPRSPLPYIFKPKTGKKKIQSTNPNKKSIAELTLGEQAFISWRKHKFSSQKEWARDFSLHRRFRAKLLEFLWLPFSLSLWNWNTRLIFRSAGAWRWEKPKPCDWSISGASRDRYRRSKQRSELLHCDCNRTGRGQRPTWPRGRSMAVGGFLQGLAPGGG